MTPLFHLDTRAVADPGDETTIQSRIRKAIGARFTNARFVAIPNGAQRTAWAAMQAKREGMATGFPDAMVIWPGGVAFVEIKTATGVLGEAQHSWLNWLTQAGFACGVFRSVETCCAWLTEQGAPTKAVALGQVAA